MSEPNLPATRPCRACGAELKLSPVGKPELNRMGYPCDNCFMVWGPPGSEDVPAEEREPGDPWPRLSEV